MIFLYLNLIFIFIYYVTISQVHSCGVIAQIGDMTPVTVTALVNSTVTLTCSLFSDSTYTSKDIVFSLNNSDNQFDSEHVTIIDDMSAKLVLRNVNESQSGSYYCKARNQQGKPIFVCVSTVYIGYKPEDKPITDFTCKHFYRKEIKCWYTVPDNKIKTHYNVIMKAGGFTGSKHLEAPCQAVELGNSKFECSWTNQFAYFPEYYFEIRYNNEMANHTDFLTFNLSSIVQLSSPKNLAFTKLDNNLTWSYPNYINRDLTLFNFVQFRLLLQEFDDPSHIETFYFDHNTLWTMLDLKPFTRYNFNLSIKIDDSNNPYWSDTSSINEITLEQAPSSPPDFISQAFETNFENLRVITIYWKLLSKKLQNSADVHYKIECLSNKIRQKCAIDRWNVTTDHTNYTFTHLDSMKEYNFRIYSENIIGSSANYSEFHLPRADLSMMRPPREISVHINHTTSLNVYNIEWYSPDANNLVHNYTVFWCVSLAGICIRPLNWSFTNSKTTKTMLYLPNDNYKFGVSANYQHTTSGIVWTDCVINYQNRISRLINLAAFAKSSNSILLQWQTLCVAQKNLIKTLHITYCPIDDCDSNRKNIIINSPKNDYLFNELLPNTVYQFNVSSSSIVHESKTTERTHLGIPEIPFNGSLRDNLNEKKFVLKWLYNSNMLEYFQINFNNSQRENVGLSKNCLQTNGNVCKYEFHYKESLKIYHDYSFSIYSCNRYHCSQPLIIHYKTKADKPGKILKVHLNRLSSTRFRVHKEVPSIPNGPIDFYIVRIWSKEDNIKEYNTSSPSSSSSSLSSNSYLDLDIECNTKHTRIFRVSMAAVNRIAEKDMIGEFSDPFEIELCNSISILYSIILSLICIILFAFFLFGFIKFCHSAIEKEGNFIPLVKMNKESTYMNEYHQNTTSNRQYDHNCLTATTTTTTTETSFYPPNNSPDSSFSSSNSSARSNGQLHNQQHHNPEYYQADNTALTQPLLSSNNSHLLQGTMPSLQPSFMLSSSVNNSSNLPTTSHLSISSGTTILPSIQQSLQQSPQIIDKHSSIYIRHDAVGQTF